MGLVERLRPIGRPWLTLAIDVASRAVLGFSVSLERPSVVSVALTLVQAVLPKDLWLADRQLEVPWPMWGLPELLQLDNAAEFHSRALVRGAQEYGIRIDYRPPGTPHFGGHIERLIGTTMGAVHLLPGTTFSNVVEKGAYSSEKTSALTLVELERWLAGNRLTAQAIRGLPLKRTRTRSSFGVCRVNGSIWRPVDACHRPGSRCTGYTSILIL